MILNLNDPNSIVAWWKVLPERHGPQLRAFAHLRPQFAFAIRAAMRAIKSDPMLRPLYERSVLAERAAQQRLEAATENIEQFDPRMAA
nr:hypothetical protein [uncultured Roseateles sp.]